MKTSSIFLPALAILTLFFSVIGCTPDYSSVKGKVVDKNNKPIPGVKTLFVKHSKILPKYLGLSKPSDKNGEFFVEKIDPGSKYTIFFSGKTWICLKKQETQIVTAPAGETLTIKKPILIYDAFDEKSHLPVLDLTTGTTRFSFLKNGIIKDNVTGREWLTGPDHQTNYDEAKEWIKNIKLDDKQWKMPTREEFNSIEDAYTLNTMTDFSKIFKTTGMYIWSEPFDDNKVWVVRFGSWRYELMDPKHSNGCRVFAVRKGKKILNIIYNTSE